MRLSKLCLIAVVLFAAAGGSLAAQTPTGPLVLAAASLQESLTAAADAFAATGQPRPVISFAASSALARQIDAGAPADLFISADEPWMDFVASKRLIRQRSRVSFLTNRLVLVTASTRPMKLDIRAGFALADALGSGKLAMADPDSVPAGKYGKAALVYLGVWRDVEHKVARAENVRAALTFVTRGEARAAIVYETDARAANGVTIVGVFPPISHPPISYPIATLASSTHPSAERFRTFLLSTPGKAIFARYGFGTR